MKYLLLELQTLDVMVLVSPDQAIQNTHHLQFPLEASLLSMLDAWFPSAASTRG